MTTADINQRFIAALAALVHHVRSDWDEPGIAAAIRRLPEALPPDAIAIGFIRGACDRSNLTPVVVADLANRAWDNDWHVPCRRHPEQSRRTPAGECASCKADRVADESPPPVVAPQRPTSSEWQAARDRFTGRTA